MKSKKAAKLFHGKEGFNCAQAVLKAYQAESGMSDPVILSATVAGGGRAIGGVCGALYAAQIILGEGESSTQITEQFREKAGSIKCKDIKDGACTCREYVEIAAELTMPYMDKIQGDNPEYCAAREKRELEMLPQVTETDD